MVAALVLTGAPGAGKSSVLDALTTLLEVDGTAYGAIESELFARGSPWLPAADWLPQLRAVVALQREAGRELLLVVATTETADELRGVVEALAADVLVAVCLDAAPDVVAARIEQREPDAWPGKQALIENARRLARRIPAIEGIDLVIETEGRSPVDVAGDVREELRARGVLPKAD